MSGTPIPQFVVLACDESGSKGYADRDEQSVGEVGVFAGIMVPGELLASAQAQFDAIAHKYETAPGKVHITDLPTAQQGQLREEMYAAIDQLQLLPAVVSQAFSHLVLSLRQCSCVADNIAGNARTRHSLIQAL